MSVRELPPITIFCGLGSMVLGGVLALIAPSALPWFMVFIGVTYLAIVANWMKPGKSEERRKQ